MKIILVNFTVLEHLGEICKVFPFLCISGAHLSLWVWIVVSSVGQQAVTGTRRMGAWVSQGRKLWSSEEGSTSVRLRPHQSLQQSLTCPQCQPATALPTALSSFQPFPPHHPFQMLGGPRSILRSLVYLPNWHFFEISVIAKHYVVDSACVIS